MKCSTSWRIIMLVVCQPLAMMPPYGLSFAATGSTWNGCGSYSVAKAMMWRLIHGEAAAVHGKARDVVLEVAGLAIDHSLP